MPRHDPPNTALRQPTVQHVKKQKQIAPQRPAGSGRGGGRGGFNRVHRYKIFILGSNTVKKYNLIVLLA